MISEIISARHKRRDGRDMFKPCRRSKSKRRRKRPALLRSWIGVPGTLVANSQSISRVFTSISKPERSVSGSGSSVSRMDSYALNLSRGDGLVHGELFGPELLV